MPRTNSNGVIRFGVFEADLRSGELRKSGVKIRLREQAFQVLSELLERPGEVVTREELRDRLWPDGTFVDFDHSLNAAVNSIREVLGDSAASPRFVETVPRRGYRFIAPVEKLGESVLGPLGGAESRPARTQATSEREWLCNNSSVECSGLIDAGHRLFPRWIDATPTITKETKR